MTIWSMKTKIFRVTVCRLVVPSERPYTRTGDVLERMLPYLLSRLKSTNIRVDLVRVVKTAHDNDEEE